LDAERKPESTTIRVLIVEDDQGYASSLCDVLRATPDMAVMGHASTLADGLAHLQGSPADVLLVDLGLPDGSGITLIEAAARQWPLCNVMVATNFGDEVHVMRSLEAGAAGYLLKDSAPARIIEEIRHVTNGGSPISPIIARQILNRYMRTAPTATPEPRPDPRSPLSAREQEVLTYITKGFTTQEIAKLMALSPFTVRSFVRRVYDKLKVSSKAEAIFEARNLGLLDD
jgi:DNA-binding NarL/FixJ family response regulator